MSEENTVEPNTQIVAGHKEIDTSKLDPLGFTDIYINFEDLNLSDVYYIGITRRLAITKEQKPHVQNLAKEVYKKMQNGSKSFRIKYSNKLYRCTIIKSINGVIADLRSQPMEIIPLRHIDIPQIIKQYCTSQRLNKGGLILVVGSPGQGKTTTCAAILLARLQRFGGLCLAIEDPAELPLDGVHGEGRCIQIEIESQNDYEEAGRMAMRCYPTDKPGLMFISEIRDAEGAALALRAALDGRLVIATMHADSIISALKRLLSLASTVMDETAARQLLFHGFRLCLHQERQNSEIRSSILIDTPSVAPLIRNGKLDQIGTQIDIQANLIASHKPIQPRGV